MCRPVCWNIISSPTAVSVRGDGAYCTTETASDGIGFDAVRSGFPKRKRPFPAANCINTRKCNKIAGFRLISNICFQHHGEPYEIRTTRPRRCRPVRPCRVRQQSPNQRPRRQRACRFGSRRPAGLVEGQNYTVLANPIPQQQAGKVEVLEFFGYFCPHCAHLEPVLSKHAKSFKDDMYLRTEHVVWQKEMLTLARLAAAVDMAAADSKDVANSHIFDAMVNQKIKLQEPEVLKKWLGEQTAFDGKKVLAAYESPESQARRQNAGADRNLPNRRYAHGYRRR